MDRKQIYLGLGIILIILLAGIPVQAGSTTFPLFDEISISTADFLLVDSSYSLHDYLLSGTSTDKAVVDLLVAGTYLEEDKMSLDLGESTFYSYSGLTYIMDRCFINDTYNAGTKTEFFAGESDITINNELQSQYYGSQLYAKATFGNNQSAYQYVTWRSNLAYDYNGDGDYSDAEDKSYNPFITDQYVLYWCAKADFSNTTDTTAYAEISFSFKTTIATNYEVEVFLYGDADYAGDSDFSNDDASGENKLTLTLYNTDNSWIASQFDIAEILENDAGDSPSIKGLDYIDVILYQTGAGNIQFYARNFAVWDKMRAITDDVDDDDDWDVDSNGVPTGVWDDNDYLVTSITEGAVESFSSLVPLKEDVNHGDTLLVSGKVLDFEGTATIDLAKNAEGSDEAQTPTVFSSSVSSGKYLTTVEFDLDTREIDDLDAPTTYWAFGDFDHNFTLKESIMYSADFTDFQDDLVSYEFHYADKKADVETAWDSATEDSDEVQFDFDNPSSSTGTIQHFKYSFYSQASHSGTVQATTTTTTTTKPKAGGGGGLFGFSENATLIGVFLIAVAGGIFSIAMMRRKK